MSLPPIFTAEVPSWVEKAARARLSNWDAKRSAATDEKKVLAVIAEYLAQYRYGVNVELDVRVGRELHLWSEDGVRVVSENGKHRPDFIFNGIPHDVKNATWVNDYELGNYPEGTRIVRVWQLHRAEGNWWNARIGWLSVDDIFNAGLQWSDDRARPQRFHSDGQPWQIANISKLDWLTPEL